MPLRVRCGPSSRVGDGSGSVHLVFKLISDYLLLPSTAPRAAFGVGNDRWCMWTQQQATTALRSVVSLTGGRTAEYALHSPRVGGVPHLSAEG